MCCGWKVYVFPVSAFMLEKHSESQLTTHLAEVAFFFSIRISGSRAGIFKLDKPLAEK